VLLKIRGLDVETCNTGIDPYEWIHTQWSIFKKLIEHGIVKEDDTEIFYKVGEYFADFYVKNCRIPTYYEVALFIFDLRD